jgi:hypothetical protein
MTIQDINEIGLNLAAEEFTDEQFQQYHAFSSTDEPVIRRLIVHGPVLLRGPRGSGKSAFMLEAHRRIAAENLPVFSAYISLRHFPLLSATSAEEYLSILIPHVADEIRKQLQLRTHAVPSSIVMAKTLPELKLGLAELASLLGRRLVLMFDDAAHIGREVSLVGFFDFFRTVSSSTVSCKASIYPGVTKFGSRFDFYNDATVMDIQRDERSPDFGEFFSQVITLRHPNLMSKVSGANLVEVLPQFLGRAVLGNVRVFSVMCTRLEDYENITIHTLGDSLKWLASGYLFPALDELQTKLGAYAPMLDIAEKLAPIFFEECGLKKANSMVIHKEHAQRLAKVFEILEYSGFIAKREASRSLFKTASGRGPRYALSLGPLFEKIPGVTLSTELIGLLLRPIIPNEELIEYSPTSSIKDFSSPELSDDHPLDVLRLPVSKLLKGNALPYGLTTLMTQALITSGYPTIQDVVKLSHEQLCQIDQIGESKAKRIRNAVEQAIWM